MNLVFSNVLRNCCGVRFLNGYHEFVSFGYKSVIGYLEFS